MEMLVSEETIKHVGFLRKSGGYSLTAVPAHNGFLVTGFFKDIGSYGTTVSSAAFAEDVETAQAECLKGLASLVHYTNNSKPANAKPAAAPASNGYSKPSYPARPAGAPPSGPTISLSGLKDNSFQAASGLLKQNGFKYDSASKVWHGGAMEALPDWLAKKAKGGVARAAEPEYSGEPDEPADVDPFGGDDMPW